AKYSMTALLVTLGSRWYRTPGRAAAPLPNVEKVRKPKSRETISRASITMSKEDSRQLQSLNHCFVPVTIVPAEQTFSTWGNEAAAPRESDTIGSPTRKESSHGTLCWTGCLDERDARLRCRSRWRRCAGDNGDD